jgi:hypothetical protein
MRLGDSKSAKIAICLFGISYMKNYDHWNLQRVNVDYKKSIQNYKQKLLDSLCSYDIYISTYKHEKISELEADLLPTASTYISENIKRGLDPDAHRQRNEAILNFVNLLREKRYDYYIFTRFDLNFNIDVSQLDIANDKVNVLAVLEKPHLICDNLYIVSHTQLHFFFNAIRKNVCCSRHDSSIFGGMCNLHIMTNEKGKEIGGLTCYKIIRS